MMKSKGFHGDKGQSQPYSVDAVEYMKAGQENKRSVLVEGS